MVTELAFLGIAEASRLIAARKLSPVELTEAYLRRIAAFDSQLDSFVTLTADRARAEAKAAEAAIMASGPVSRLHGIPSCLKDISFFRLTGPDTVFQASAALACRGALGGQCDEAVELAVEGGDPAQTDSVSSTGDSLRAAISRDASAMPRKASSVTIYSFPGRKRKARTHGPARRHAAGRGNPADHPADMAIGLDQLGHILCRQNEPAWRASWTFSSSDGVSVITR